ncbi:MAG TPA: DNA polymerase/3'-5' exonuclease PolX [Candidatus Aminicenantes bacterium]|nr:DNA polymerase/3'-5' exonuclease PolX [Candidatus Aminicenantes bacterium]HRY64018.1 DNA polymerase/3'-5' exonuclease PolX [Candidatus Aminicenantes bacterium]HRZ70931.1 DNA polymerase/3'-5' exonuclease PolX [Candidatus Aminicenantes bacterium]
MPIHNNDIAAIFDELADLLEIKGENPFRVRAYRNAARTVAGLSRGVAELAAEEKGLDGIPGIGRDLADKIRTIVATKKLPLLEEMKKELPEGLSTLMKVRGLGPKKIAALHKALNVSSLADLRKAASGGKIRELPGFSEKTEQALLDELGKTKITERGPERFKRALAEQMVTPLFEELKKARGVEEISIAGSYRRQAETVGDVDILVAAEKSRDVMDRFVHADDVTQVLAEGDTKSSVLLRGGLQVDLRVVPLESWGAALHYFTGSKAHNIAVRLMGVKRKLKVNEYGVFRGKKMIAGRTEAEIYKLFGLPYIEPELREDRGEIQAALEGRLPRLVELRDIRGDLHSHTRATDGRYSAEEMAGAAKARGYEYLAVTDHSKRVTMAHGLDAARLAQSIREIDRINARLKGVTLLKSIECDILADGSLDLPDAILGELDLVVCSIHYNFNLSKDKQTERVIRALDNRRVNIFCHPTGRLINERPGYEIDLEKVMRAAVERGCFLELNAHPDRLDLDDVHCRMAGEMGLKIAVSTDAHSTGDLDLMRFGIGQARRGWIEAADVINTRPLAELRRLLKRT